MLFHSVSEGQESRSGLAGVLAQGLSQDYSQAVVGVCKVWLEVENLLQVHSHGYWQAAVLQWLLDRGFSFLLHGPYIRLLSQHGTLLSEREKQEHLGWKPQSFCDIISEAIYHHFYFMLLVTQTNPATIWGCGGAKKTVTNKRQRLLGAIQGFPTTPCPVFSIVGLEIQFRQWSRIHQIQETDSHKLNTHEILSW